MPAYSAATRTLRVANARPGLSLGCALRLGPTYRDSGFGHAGSLHAF